MSEDRFPFDRDFQIEVLSLCCHRQDFMLFASDLIQPKYFEDKVLVWYYQRMLEHFERYKSPPSKVALKNELIKGVRSEVIKESEIKDYSQVWERLLPKNIGARYIQDEVVRFCRRQAAKRVYLETVPMMDAADDDDWDSIVERMFKIRQIGLAHLDVGLRYFEDYESRIERRADETKIARACTGIHGWHPETHDPVDFDILIGGGVKVGQIGIWMGGTGVGKSISLPHCGKRAVVDGKKVVHYTLELDKDEIADRYDASWSGIRVRELTANAIAFEQKMEKLHSKYGDSLIIQEYPAGGATVNTIRSHLRQLELTGWIPEVVIVDYLDLIKPTTSYKSQYEDLGAITRDLRGLAKEANVSMWTATQVNRPGLVEATVDVQHIGDSLQKAQIADIIIAMCQTPEERDSRIMRLYLAKNRNGPAKRQIEIKTDYARMCLWDPTGEPISPSATGGAPDAPPGLPPK